MSEPTPPPTVDPPVPHPPDPPQPPVDPSEAPPRIGPSPAPPPAAKTVLEGTRTERELALERDVKERERRINSLEDENRQLKTLPKPEPARRRDGEPEKRGWLAGATFFDEDDEETNGS